MAELQLGDGRFTLAARTRLGGCLIDIVDEAWLSDVLPDDEISIPAGQDVASEDEGFEETSTDDQAKADKWLDMGLNNLESA